MKYAVVFSSRTGNTARLAEALKEDVPAADCVYFGGPDERALAAPMIFVGFWTDKGSCDEAAKDFLKTLRDKKVFLFGTAGFGGSREYFEKIISGAKANLDATVQVMGSFMCQGRMPDTVLKRYENMLSEAADPARIQEMIDNFHKAATHPDEADLDGMKIAANQIAKECR